MGENLLSGWRSSGNKINIPGTITLRHPPGERGWYQHGFREFHDGASDWRDAWGLRLTVDVDTPNPVSLIVTLTLPPQISKDNYVTATSSTFNLTGKGGHMVTLPWRAFDFQQAQPAFLKFIQKVEISASTPESSMSVFSLQLVSAEVVPTDFVRIDAPVRGKSTEAGGTVRYEAVVTNYSQTTQAITLTEQREGWQAMRVRFIPHTLLLQPGESAPVEIEVSIPDSIPAGGMETQKVLAIPNGEASKAPVLELTTASAVPHPYILHTPERWEEVRAKVADHEWARAAQQRYVDRAEAWGVPEIAAAPDNLTGEDNFGPFLFHTGEARRLLETGIAYQLTDEIRYARKVRTFMLRLSDPEKGYPATLRGCNESLVQEGAFFQRIAMAYDMALPSGLFSQQDQAQIENTLRLLIATISFQADMGAINNWYVAETCGALYSALALQDMSLAERFYAGPTGILDQIGKGVLDDGWWYECAVGYHLWCSSEFTQAALALEPWGINLRNMKVPVAYGKNYGLRPWEMKDGLYGMSFEKWGPVTRPFVTLRQMWDAIPPFADYRGVMFAINDATERRLGGEPYELAYYVFRDPAYAAMIRRSGEPRDLLYGIPELPEDTLQSYRQSEYADNVGVAMLRSQSPDRPMRDQIQAVLHYGTHGGFHGHFDRASLLHLSRYGRSFYNPEMAWFGYASFMYKFYVQNSTSKNMVVVDRKMQQPVESKRLLFYSGTMMQAAAVETVAPWATPPYGGMQYSEQGYGSLQDKAFGEGRWLPQPDPEPAYGSITDFTEPILQRRLMLVLDDYVVLADYLQGNQPHIFENLLQMKGFDNLQAEQLQHLNHSAQWDPNPVLDAQFVTDCDWYSAKAPLKARFEMRWGPEADNAGTRTRENEDGVLKFGVYSAWPLDQKVMIGTVPEHHNVAKQLFWEIRGDGERISQGAFGAWILGQENIDVPIEGVKKLVLETRVALSRQPTVFWADARVILRDGREIPIADLPTKQENLQVPSASGKDFFGGPVKIFGNPYQQTASGQPEDGKHPGILTLDLSGLDSVRFKAVLGGDFPLGDEAQRRKTMAVQSIGTGARFLTVIEPYESRPAVTRVTATDADSLRVELKDGRVQEIYIHGLEESGDTISVKVEERQGAELVRTEQTPD